jgi:hypothetical protein
VGYTACGSGTKWVLGEAARQGEARHGEEGEWRGEVKGNRGMVRGEKRVCGASGVSNA